MKKPKLFIIKSKENYKYYDKLYRRFSSFLII